MSVRIVIQQNGVFEEAHALASDLVFWRNEDTSQPSHSPFGLRVDSGQVSNALQPNSATQPIAQPARVEYTCTEHGEKGVLWLYNDFVVVRQPIATSSATVPIVTGGRSPYSMSALGVSPNAISVSLIATPPSGNQKANAGISAVLTNLPPAAVTVTFTLNANDSLDNNLDQQLITIQYKP